MRAIVVDLFQSFCCGLSCSESGCGSSWSESGCESGCLIWFSEFGSCLGGSELPGDSDPSGEVQRLRLDDRGSLILCKIYYYVRF